MKIRQSKLLKAREEGFALIVTISMMVLLALLAVGLLSLSSVALRSSTQSNAKAIAQANARLALAMAIGDLQKYAGPDTRATARADILDEANPPVTGVWRSWEGENHERSGSRAGRPISVDYDSEKRDRFLSWLVSAEGDQVPNTSPGASKVTLVGEGTVGQGSGREALQIHLPATEIVEGGGPQGAMAWWVGGENQKARIPKPIELDRDTEGQWATKMKSHAVADPEVFRMGALLDDASLADKAITMQLADFIATDGELETSKEFFHDLSAVSVGLQTNMATGGWKKDLSLFTENQNRGTQDLPLFRLSPDEDSLANMATNRSPLADKSLFYPWSAYRTGSGNAAFQNHGAVTSWANLVDFATLYKEMPDSGSGSIRSRGTELNASNNAGKFSYLHQVRIIPIIARIQWVFSHYSVPSQVPRARDGDLEARLLMTPVITMWNPYSVGLTFADSPLTITIPRPLPMALSYAIGSQPADGNFNSLTGNQRTNGPPMAATNRLVYRINSNLRLAPGETQVFSPRSSDPVPASGSPIDLAAGYRSGGGFLFEVKDNRGQKVSAQPGTAINAVARFDTEYLDRDQGVGIYMNVEYGSGRRDMLYYRMTYTPDVARRVYPVIDGLAGTTLGEAQGTPQPFITTIFGARMASNTHVAAKGFVQSSPLVSFSAMGDKPRFTTNIDRPYGGTQHPVNSAFDYSFRPITGVDSLLPNSESRTNRGYIVTGFGSSDGLSRCVVAELPSRPLQSLPELQHWDLRYDNPIAPFAFNIIGNSDASPVLPSNAVVNRADENLSTNLQHDDFYCANHLLFDDWFISSIAPDPNSFGDSGRSQEEVYRDFLTGERRLPNQAYRPTYRVGGGSSSSEVNQLFREHVEDREAWRSIASRLEVEGMFNVNSTSLNAWRALLRHARNKRVPFLSESGSSVRVDLSNETDHAVSRFSVAGDVEATEQGSAGQFPESAEFSGYREFDEDQLDALAERVVEQVRLRGPFLSLSEFVNRQLSRGDLALAGALQAALNELAESSDNPFDVLQSGLSRQSFAQPLDGSNPEYQFPEAAAGYNTYGLPGWTRQADILRPLAPVLTARDDTFTVRAYGDARDAAGNITARAVCEAVIQRSGDYVDAADPPDTVDFPVSQVNRTFGRKMNLVSFRWLSPSEI